MDSTESSLDELALSEQQSRAALPPRARSKTPLIPRSPNIRSRKFDFDAAPDLRSSPSKSMILETGGKPGSSPWRIKVTVQAEPQSDGETVVTPTKQSTTSRKAITVPLKDADDYSPAKRPRGRPRKSDGAISAIRKRKGTPMRPRSTKASGGEADVVEGNDDQQQSRSDEPPKRRPGRPKKAAKEVDDGLAAISSQLEDPTAVEAISKRRGRPRKSVQPSDFTTTIPAHAPSPSLPQEEQQAGIMETSGQTREEDAPARIDPAHFDFTKLTPLHQKHVTASPRPQKRLETQTVVPQDRTGVVPQGWSATVFSPLPPRSSYNKTPPVRHREGKSEQTQRRPRAAEELVHVLDKDTHSVDEDVDMWRGMVGRKSDDISTQSEQTPGPESDDSDFGEVPELTGRLIGEETLMQSEEFSMVSLDSLQSARELQSSFVDTSQLNTAKDSAKQAGVDTSKVQTLPPKGPSRLSRSWFPGSSPKEGPPPAELLSQHSSELSRSLSKGSVTKSSSQARSPNSTEPSQQRYSSRPFSSPFQSKVSELNHERSGKPTTSPNSGTVHIESSRDYQRQSSLAISPSNHVALNDSQSIFGQNAFASANYVPVLDTHNTPTKTSQTQDQKPPEELFTKLTSTIEAEARLPTPDSAEKDMHSLNVSEDGAVEYPIMHPSSPPEITASPAKSDGAMSWQTHTPPSSRRATSSHIEEEEELDDIRLTSSAQRRGVFSQEYVREKERQWHRAREEVSRTIQSAKKDHVIVVESDDDEGEDEEEGEDVWQEEASRSSHLRDDSQLESSKLKPADKGGKIFPPVEPPQQLRRPKVSRTWRRISANDSVHDSDTEARREDFQISAVHEEHSRQRKNAAEISALFKSVSNSKHSREASSAEDSEDSDDTGMFWQRNLPSVFDGKNKRTQEPATKVGATPSNQPSQNNSHTVAVSIAPVKSSPLKRQLGDDIEAAGQNTSFTEGNISTTSDVRQLRNEMKSSRLAQTSRINGEHRRLSNKSHNIDDTRGEEHDTHANSSMLSIAPRRPRRPLLPNNDTAEEKEQHVRKAASASPKQAPASQAQTTRSSPAPGLISRVWSSLPFKQTSPLRPTHPLLKDLPLLPCAEPWTKTHYRTMDALYKRYKHSPASFSTSHPANTGLITPAFLSYINLEIRNWGYSTIMNPSLIILASLFTCLLVLKDADEYERLEGKPIEIGACVPGKEGMEFRAWTVVIRLFSVVAGELVRADEKVGREIDRREGMLRWRFEGQMEWVWARDVGADGH